MSSTTKYPAVGGALGAMVAAGMVAAAASAAPATRTVHITPAARAIMRQFPRGSCGRDPFQSKCPGTTRFAFAQSDLRHPPHWLGSYLGSHGRFARDSLSGCNQHTFWLKVFDNNEVSYGSQRCWFVEWHQVDMRIWEQARAGNWVDEANSTLSYQTGPGTIYVGARSRYCYTLEGRRWSSHMYGAFHEPPLGFGTEYMQTDYRRWGCEVA